MADVGNLLVGIGAVGAVIVSAFGLKMRDAGEDDATYWRRRFLECEDERDLALDDGRDRPSSPRARRRRKDPR